MQNKTNKNIKSIVKLTIIFFIFLQKLLLYYLYFTKKNIIIINYYTKIILDTPPLDDFTNTFVGLLGT